ncbi:MAG: c-type cytochrome [Bacteroidota bacterium]
MIKILKWLGIITGGLIVIIGLVAGYGIMQANALLEERLDITPETISLPSDSASLVRGEYLAYGCRECHGANLEGKLWFGNNDEEEQLAIVHTANLTSAPGSKTASYTDADWVRTIRHGVSPEKKLLFVMPSGDYNKLSERDLGCLIAYLKQVKPVEHPVGTSEFKPIGKILLGLGMFGDVFLGKVIDHSAPFPTEPSRDSTIAWGGYVIGYLGCSTCHGVDYAGGTTGQPGAPLVPVINTAGHLKDWTAEQFATTIRTGQTPEGKILNVKFMPFSAYQNLTDADFSAMDAFLRSIPARPQNTGGVNLGVAED